jgi:hypothetical protein
MTNYSGTKCPKCESKNFELAEDAPNSSRFKFYYLRCSSCKTFLALVPYYDTNSKIDKLLKHFNLS